MDFKTTLKKKIKEKFGMMSRFARLANEDRYGLQKLFAKKSITKAEFDRVNILVKRTEVRTSGREIDPKKFAQLKKALDEAGGVAEFCRKNSQFSVDTMKHIYQGRRKVKGPVIDSLFAHFEIE